MMKSKYTILAEIIKTKFKSYESEIIGCDDHALLIFKLPFVSIMFDIDEDDYNDYVRIYKYYYIGKNQKHEIGVYSLCSTSNLNYINKLVSETIKVVEKSYKDAYDKAIEITSTSSPMTREIISDLIK